MIKSLSSHREYLRELFLGNYYKVQCDYCNNDLIVSKDSCEIDLFKPKEIAYDAYDVDSDCIKRSVLQTFSSSPSKDIFTCKCPECGHIIKLTRKEFEKEPISWRGTREGEVVLNEKENCAYKKFISAHVHNVNYDAHGFPKLQYPVELRITQTLLGDFKKCVCTKCGAEQEITDVDKI